jgi:hypothetical protein
MSHAYPFELSQFLYELYFFFLLYALYLLSSFFLFETQPHLYLGLESEIC